MAPKVEKRIHNRNGKEIKSKHYYFRAIDFDGKRKYINTYKTNKRDAEQYKKNWFQELEQKKIDNAFIPPNTESFLEYLRRPNESWLIPEQNPKYNYNKKASNKSYGLKQAKRVSGLLKKVFITYDDELGSVPYNQIKKNDALSFWYRLEKYNAFSPRTKNEVLKALSAIYTFLENTDTSIEYNPFKKLNRFRENPIPRKGFSLYQIKNIFDEDKIREKDAEFIASDGYKILKLAIATGMRVGEIRALNYGQLIGQRSLRIDRAFKDVSNREEDIGLPKWNKTRTIVLCDTALDIIDYHVYLEDYDKKNNTIINLKNPEEYIFKNKKNEPYSYTYVHKKWKRFKEIMGISNNYCIHSLRASFSGIMRMEGIPENGYLIKAS